MVSCWTLDLACDLGEMLKGYRLLATLSLLHKQGYVSGSTALRLLGLEDYGLDDQS